VVDDVRSRARAAAGGGDVRSRVAAYGELCREIGEISSYYHRPKVAACLLVKEAARSYRDARKGAHV
jgi:hypothetical protein